MCCDDKCMFFISVRTGSLIFGYIAAVISGIVLLICTGFLIYFYTFLFDHHERHVTDLIFILQMLFVELTTGFTCTVLLLFGISKNKPVLIKTYIIYGMIHLGLLIIMDIILFCTCLPVLGILMFLGCGLYAMLIYMTYLTYKGMINSGNGYLPQINPNPAMVNSGNGYLPQIYPNPAMVYSGNPQINPNPAMFNPGNPQINPNYDPNPAIIKT